MINKIRSAGIGKICQNYHSTRFLNGESDASLTMNSGRFCIPLVVILIDRSNPIRISYKTSMLAIDCKGKI